MEKINFKNLPDETTPINASNLNKMQDNIEADIQPLKENILSNNLFDGKLLTDKSRNANTGVVGTFAGYSTTENILKVKGGKSIVISINGVKQTARIFSFDKDGKFISSSSNGGQAVALSEDTCYFSFNINSTLLIGDIMVNYGTEPMEYEKYVNAIAEIEEKMDIITITNDNGTAIKFPDGTMICTIRKTVTDQEISTALGSLFQGTRTWTFPQEFVAIPNVTCGMFKWGTGLGWGAVAQENKASAVLIGYDLYSRATGTNVRISATAIGRWK